MATVVQGPTGDDDENKSQKAWTMEMLKKDGDISMSTTNGSEQVSEDYKRSCTTGLHTQTMQYNTICNK